MILGLAVFVELRLVTVGQRDGQTHDDSIYRASVASRSKKAVLEVMYIQLTVSVE